MNYLRTPNENVAENITLTKVNAYAVEAAEDERRNTIIGYFKEYSVADLKKNKAGWYGSNGRVRSVILHTDGKQLYEVRPLGNYSDVAENEHNEIVAAIKAKLSPGELEFIAANNGKI